ncbi:MAG: hypothetical protein ABEJ44_02125 [Halanaeroarchaeum sp.]
MAITGGSVPFAVDDTALSSVNDAVAGGGLSPLVDVVLLAVFLGLVVVGIAGVLSHVYAANDRLERELRELIAEREAYRAFAQAVDRISVDRPAATTATPQTVQSLDRRGASVEAIRRAFEDTVMAVDHYEDTYGEPWDTHLTNEFESSVVSSLRTGGRINEPIKNALTQGSLEAASRRDDLVSVLTAERSALEDAASTIEAVDSALDELNEDPLPDRSFEDLAETHETLGSLDERIDSLARDRQRDIHRESRSSGWESKEVRLQEYLYCSLPVTYPVLHAAVELSDDVRMAGYRVRNAITARV